METLTKRKIASLFLSFVQLLQDFYDTYIIVLCYQLFGCDQCISADHFFFIQLEKYFWSYIGITVVVCLIVVVSVIRKQMISEIITLVKVNTNQKI